MNAQGIYSGYAFTRNPIILRGTGSMASMSNGSIGKFEVIYDQLPIYQGSFSSPLSINVAEIVDAFVPFFPELSADNVSPIVQLEGVDDFEHRKMLCRFELDSVEDEFECFVVPGGISRRNLKHQIQSGRDIFQARFLNPSENFFLTTRTASRLLTIKETELYPLYFLVESSGTSIVIKECATGATYEARNLDAGVAVLDVAAARRHFSERENVLASVFDVYYNSTLSCRIVVEHCEPSQERYRLKFRNSLGVFEIIELTGELSIGTEYGVSEDSDFTCLDPDIAAFYTDRERLERKQTITVETGEKRPDEIYSLMDMLGSEDVYLLDFTATPLKVLPSIEEMTYMNSAESPQSYSLKLEISLSEINIMQEIIAMQGNSNNLFAKQFSKLFN